MNKQKLYLGCDPGMSGAIAVTLNGAAVKVIQMPTRYRGDKHEPDLYNLVKHLAPLAKHQCVLGIEDVFTFGSTYDTPLTAWQLSSAVWAVRGVAAGLGMEIIMVTSRDWKKHYKLWGIGREDSKAAAIMTIKEDYSKEFPAICPKGKRGGVRQPSADFAEALLIAKYIYQLKSISHAA